MDLDLNAIITGLVGVLFGSLIPAIISARLTSKRINTEAVVGDADATEKIAQAAGAAATTYEKLVVQILAQHQNEVTVLRKRHDEEKIAWDLERGELLRKVAAFEQWKEAVMVWGGQMIACFDIITKQLTEQGIDPKCNAPKMPPLKVRSASD